MNHWNCKVNACGGGSSEEEAEFLGLLMNEHGELVAVIKYDKSGMMLDTVHPSRVTIGDEVDSDMNDVDADQMANISNTRNPTRTETPMAPTQPNTIEVKTLLSMPYSWVLVPQGEGGFFAKILEFPGCFAEGDTVEEVALRLQRAAADWLEACLEKGDRIPPPLTNYIYNDLGAAKSCPASKCAPHPITNTPRDPDLPVLNGSFSHPIMAADDDWFAQR